ncbi:hypothetical protein IJT17_01500 [bacterium]|nr:hypothetical protein [bacterium]
MKLSELAELLNGTVRGDGDIEIIRVCGADEQHPQAITFAEDLKSAALAERHNFAALLTSEKISTKLPCIVVSNPRIAYAKALNIFYPPRPYIPGVHPLAIVAPTAKVAASAYVGPYAIVEEGAEIADGAAAEAHTLIGANSYLGANSRLLAKASMGNNCRIGADCLIGAHTIITDGTTIGDDVEIGARCLLENCQISSKCRLDNMVLVRSEAVLAPGVIMVSHSSIMEEAQVGYFCVLAAQATIGPRAKVGNYATIGGRVFVSGEIPEGQMSWAGDPPLPYKEHMHRWAQRNSADKAVKKLQKAIKKQKD